MNESEGVPTADLPSAFKGAWLYAEPQERPSTAPDSVGKWMVFVSRDHVDVLWSSVRAAVTDRNLGISAKVSTGTGSSFAHGKDSHVVIVYCADWKDLNALRMTLIGLRALGVAQPVYFKRDRETRAGDYSAKGKRNISVWGSSSGDVIETRRVGDGKTRVLVTEDNLADVIEQIERQDRIAASLASQWTIGADNGPEEDGWVPVANRRPGGYDEQRVAEDGSRAWYRFGQLHRLDGPAYIGPNGEEQWWQVGRRYRTHADWDYAAGRD